MLTYEYYARVEALRIDRRISRHHSIVSGSAPYQSRFRVLLPYTAEAIARLVQQFPIVSAHPPVEPLSYSKPAFVLTYCFLNLTALFILLRSLGELVWRLFTYHLALFSISLSALLVNFTFRDHYYHPWSLWEGAFFALGLLLILQQKYWLFTGVSFLGLLNRETSVFLLLAFLLCAFPSEMSKDKLIEALRKRDMRFAVGNLFFWALGLLVLHQVVGYKPPTFLVENALRGNRARLMYAVFLNFALIGFVLPMVLKGIRRSPLLIRRSAMMLPAYFALLLVIGYWWEIRYWITVIPIVIPFAAAVGSASPRRGVPEPADPPTWAGARMLPDSDP